MACGFSTVTEGKTQDSLCCAVSCVSVCLSGGGEGERRSLEDGMDIDSLF